MIKGNWSKLKLNNINLSGIHLDILKIQSEGLTKHIGSVFEDLSDHSAWLGGTGESWERGPYYVDGLIPLAYLLKDQNLINSGNKWINSIIDSQDKSGFFGPRQNSDWWPRLVVVKALVSYYYASQDERIPLFLHQYYEYLIQNIDESPYEFWGFARGLEGKEALDLLNQLGSFPKTKLLEDKLLENTLDWQLFFYEFPYIYPTTRYLNKFLFHAIKPILIWIDRLSKNKKQMKNKTRNNILKSRKSKTKYTYLTTHGVNIAMSLKYLVYMQEDQKIGEEKLFEALEKILLYHGNALDLFSSDEHLNGTSPSQGIELCVIVEMMYSMEETIRLTGSFKAADYLEYYAYNALLTTISQDFCSHQYVQQINQLDCEVKKHPFFDTDKYANTFGIEPNFGCCAANMHQGWPKMMMSAIMKSKTSLAFFLYISGTYRVDFDDGYALIQVDTNYPFADLVKIKCLELTTIQLKEWVFRIPYLESAKIVHNQIEKIISEKESLVIKNVMQDDEINLFFNFEIKTITNQDKSISIRRGPLLFAKKIECEEFYIKGSKPFHDRGYIVSSYNKQIPFLKDGKVIVKSFEKLIDSNCFFKNNLSVIIEGVNPNTLEHQEMHLVPYGLTILRETQFIRREE
ncbi:MAG: glycoside hydrolase family 127 protein [Firmicutes bacterium]|nr:glycoside hydrolase family 127 protein [Bacillota bacterium]